MSRTRRKVPKDRSLRYPKTQSEKRSVAASLEDGVPVRAKRNVKNLRDSFDDDVIAANYEIVEKALDDKANL